MNAPPPETERPPVAATTEGQSNAVEANALPLVASIRDHDKPEGQRPMGRMPNVVFVANEGGRRWRYGGKRGRVLSLLAHSARGVTQLDCLPWHTRLGGTIHALRRDGLAISTELEGEYRHARYRLHTPGRLERGEA